MEPIGWGRLTLFSSAHIRTVGKGQIDAPLQGLGWEIYPNGDGFYLAHGGGGFGSEMRLYPGRSLRVVVIANDTTYDRGQSSIW